MDFLTDPQFWLRWIGIVLLDLCLAGDNALIIALAVRKLPPKQQFWGRVWGSLGAVLLRVLFISIVSWLLNVPFLRLVGGLMLVWIAVKLVRQNNEDAGDVREGGTLRQAIGIIVVADVVMSLDNVVAISGAAKGDLVLVIFGLLLSLPLVVWGSGLLARLMNRFPAIIWIGGGVLGYVAVDMIMHDGFIVARLGEHPSAAIHPGMAILSGILLTLLGWWLARGTGRASSHTENV